MKKDKQSDNVQSDLEPTLCSNESCQKYKELLELLPDVVFEADLELNLTYVNKAAFNKFGYTKAEFEQGINIADTLTTEYISKALANIKLIFQGVETSPSEYEMKRKDGSTFRAQVHSRPIIRDNRIVGVRGTVSDISELTQALINLHESEEKYRSIVEYSHEAIMIVNDRYQFIFCNNEMSNLLGYSREELIGQDFRRFLDKSSVDLVAERYRRRQRGEEIPKKYEFQIIRKNGEKRTVEIISSVYTDSQGQVRSVAQLLDVTDQKEIELAKLELDRRRLEFIEGISHELRTPITGLKAFIELLERSEGLINLERQNVCYKAIYRNINLLERLIKDVSDISKFERGLTIELEKSETNLLEFIFEEVQLYESLLNHQFKYIIKINKHSNVFVNIDKERISQVLANIIDNAIKNTSDEKRKIFLNVEVYDEAYVQIKISDNGAGIIAENLDSIFDQFKTFPTKYSVAGSGIGLFLCKMIVEKHDGRIIAESAGLDKGATFTIFLPYQSNRVNNK